MKKSLIIVPSLLMVGLLSVTASPASAASHLDGMSSIPSTAHVVTVTTPKVHGQTGPKGTVKTGKHPLHKTGLKTHTKLTKMVKPVRKPTKPVKTSVKSTTTSVKPATTSVEPSTNSEP